MLLQNVELREDMRHIREHMIYCSSCIHRSLLRLLSIHQGKHSLTVNKKSWYISYVAGCIYYPIRILTNYVYIKFNVMQYNIQLIKNLIGFIYALLAKHKRRRFCL